MSSIWQRRRTPDEVPTPVAVAVSDYCRRAGAPASAAEVREALSALGPEDDFRARALADGEPEARPLGPFAVVDVLFGAAAALASQRETSGYYGLAQELLALSARPPAGAAPEPALAPAPEEAARPTPPERPAARRSLPARAPTLQERIAPKRKGARTTTAAPAPEAAEGDAELPQGPAKRELPKPRGRYTRLDTPKASLQELFAPSHEPTLAGLIAQYRHRPALLKALQESYVSRSGGEPSLADLDAVLERHGLLERVVGLERELILSAYQEHRGAQGRVAWALGVRPEDLERWVIRLGLRDEVEELRERFRREALTGARLAARLDLIGRTRYLQDLGIAERFARELREQLESDLRPFLPTAQDLADAYRLAGRALGVAPELLSRACEKLGLSAELSHSLRDSVHPLNP